MDIEIIEWISKMSWLIKELHRNIELIEDFHGHGGTPGTPIAGWFIMETRKIKWMISG